MEPDAVDKLAEELGSISAINTALLENLNQFQNNSCNEKERSIDDLVVLCEYAGSYVEQCFDILLSMDTE